jgi:hypothetical protein
MFFQDELSFDTGLLEGELNLKQYFKTERAWEFEKYLNEFLTLPFLIREADNPCGEKRSSPGFKRLRTPIYFLLCCMAASLISSTDWSSHKCFCHFV